MKGLGITVHLTLSQAREVLLILEAAKGRSGNNRKLSMAHGALLRAVEQHPFTQRKEHKASNDRLHR